jgi:hypothetical protein
VFGGVGLESDNVGSFWRWTDQTWEMINHTGPSARSGHAMAFDPKRDVLVLHGGYSGDHSIADYLSASTYGTHYDEEFLLDDTWEWDGNEWKKVYEDGPYPSRSAQMVFDEQRNELVLIGGIYQGGYNEGTTPHTAQVWSWNGERWREIETLNFPELTNLNASYDTVLDKILMVGNNSEFNMEAWLLMDDLQWEKVNTQDIYISGGNQMVYDWKRQKHVLFNGVLTYEIGSDLLRNWTAVADWKNY